MKKKKKEEEKEGNGMKFIPLSKRRTSTPRSRERGKRSGGGEALNRLRVFPPSFVLSRFHFPATLESRPV